MLEGIGRVIGVLMWVAIVCVPLAIWKLIEIVIWLFDRVTIIIN
jgi:hypothetical protein